MTLRRAACLRTLTFWKGETLKQRKKDMLGGRLLDVCAKCQGVK